MFKTKTTILAALASVGLAISAGSAIAADQATGDQLKAMISGNTMQGSGPVNTYAEYYAPDGTLRGKGYAGKWKVEGEQACMDYGSGWSCWTVAVEGNAGFWYQDGKVTAAGMMIPGNPNNF